MSTGYDGSIRIDSRINEAGFNKGITRMIAGVRKLGLAIGVAFGVRAVANFGKTAVSEASNLASALVGLQSITDGSGLSFSKAKSFIDEYTQDGLIPATNAINAYKNLALRGYDTSQIEQTLTILKDTAAFGRQASLTMGGAIESATEGLKNENSILVDNAGVTKNVAKMWDDYAKSIGTTSDNLTQQQKIQAEINGLIEESRFQIGDAAKLADTYAGKVSELSTAFYNFKVAIGNIFIPILEKLIPLLTNTVNWLTVLANQIARVVSLFLGVDTSVATSGLDDMTDSANAAADATNNLTDSTKASEEAAKGALASFDDLNVLQMDTGDGSSDSDSSAGSISSPEIPTIDTEGQTSALDVLSEKIETLKEKLAGLFGPTIESLKNLGSALEPLKNFVATALIDFYNEFLVPVGTWVLGEGLPRFIQAITDGLGNIDWENINESLRNLWDALEPFAITVGEGLLWFWENVLVPLGTWVINDLLPAFLGTLAAVLNVLNEALIALAPMGQWLWDNFLQPIAEWTGGAIISILEWLTEKLNELATWIRENPEKFQNIIIVIGIFAAALAIVAGIISFVAGIGGVLVGVLTTLVTVWGFLTAPITLVVLAIAAVIAIIILLIKNFDWVKETAGKIWDWVLEKWESTGISDWFNEKVVAPIKEAWEPLKAAINDFAVVWEENILPVFKKIYDVIALIISFIIGTVWNVFKSFATFIFNIVWGTIKNVFQLVFDILGTAIQTVARIIAGIMTIITGIITFLTGVFTGDWEKAWEGIKTIVEGIWETITAVIKGAINIIIDFVNGMIRGIVSGINAVIKAINRFSFDIPDKPLVFGDLAGTTIGFNMQEITAPQIPKLATGAVIPPNAEFAAILGDQSGHKNLELPEPLLRQVVAEEVNSALSDQNIRISFEGSLASLVRELRPYIVKENNRIGKSLISGI